MRKAVSHFLLIFAIALALAAGATAQPVTRPVTGTLRKIDGTPWVSAKVSFTLEKGSFNSTDQYPISVVTALTDTAGRFTVTLWANADALRPVRYRCVLPDNDYFYFTLPAGASVDIASLRASATVTPAPTNQTVLQGMVDTHSVKKASAAELGHVRVGSGLAIDVNGILSATGGGGGGAGILDELTDVVISGPSSGKFLRHNGTTWVDGVIQAGDLPAAIDAAKLANGSVSNTEFQALDGVTSAIQTQLNGKAATAHAHSAADLTSGTIPDARFPATLPAISAANLTGLNAAALASGLAPTARIVSGTVTNQRCLRVNASGVIETHSTDCGAGGGGGSGTVNSGQQYRFGFYSTTGTAISDNSRLTENAGGTKLSYTGTDGIEAPKIETTGSGPSVITQLEGTLPATEAGKSLLSPDATSHRLQLSNNNGAFSPVVTAASIDNLTGKTISTASNTISGLGTTNFTAGNLSGNGTKLTTTTGTLTNGNCVKVDSNGNLVDHGSACGGGGGGSRTEQQWRQVGSCGSGGIAPPATDFYFGTSNQPTKTCRGSNIEYGALAFTGGDNDYIVAHFAVPSDWTSGAMSLVLRGAQGLAVTNVSLNIQTGFVANGEAFEPTYNTAQTLTFSPASAVAWTQTLSNLTTTGAAAGKNMFVKVTRTDLGDDVFLTALELRIVVP